LPGDEDERHEHDGPVPRREAEGEVGQSKPGGDEPPQVVALEEAAVEEEVDPGHRKSEVGDDRGHALVSHSCDIADPRSRRKGVRPGPVGTELEPDSDREVR
jgi:hypothetical protein